MMDISSLSPEERKRFYAELRQNEEYKKNRKVLLSVTVMSGVAQLLVVLLVLNGLIPEWLVMVDLVLIIVFYMYFAFKSARRQNEIVDRFKSTWGKKTKIKEKRRKNQ